LWFVWLHRRNSSPAFIVVCLAFFSAAPFDAQMGRGAEICIR
jgi:hypothetical protein